MEFATIFVGVLAVAGFGLGFWEAVLALALGSAIGGVTQGILSMRGPRYGVPQMVLSRLGFGYWGNALPAGLNSVTAGIGWFAVNSVSGALALNVLTHMPQVLCLLIIVAVQVVVAFFGYNLVHLFERYAFPVLTVIFLIAAGVILSKAHPGASHHTIPGAFLLSSARRSATRSAGTRTRRTTRATSSRTRASAPSPCGPGRAVLVLRPARDRRRRRRHHRSDRGPARWPTAASSPAAARPGWPT